MLPLPLLAMELHHESECEDKEGVSPVAKTENLESAGSEQRRERGAFLAPVWQEQENSLQQPKDTEN
jgi:hypothetical protein